jgi:hypothetical protein|tara:strand:- start:666 stop:812 length:147 start_codon:yes stop_codon:yes gene_type:complete
MESIIGVVIALIVIGGFVYKVKPEWMQVAVDWFNNLVPAPKKTTKKKK